MYLAKNVSRLVKRKFSSAVVDRQQDFSVAGEALALRNLVKTGKAVTSLIERPPIPCRKGKARRARDHILQHAGARSPSTLPVDEPPA